MFDSGTGAFLGAHSVRIFADGWRTQVRAHMGVNAYKGIYTLVSLLGFGLIIWGFGMVRDTPTVLWLPPTGMRHAAALLDVIAFVFLVAAVFAMWLHGWLIGVKPFG